MAGRKRKSDKVIEDTSFFEINEFELDKEWIQQPKLFFDWAEKLAAAKLDLEECKSHLELVKAELDRDIRADPEAYELEKTTESSISNCVLTQVECKEAQQMIREARHKVDVLQAAVTALDHRKRALQDLVALHGQSYFATPKAPEGSEEKIDRIEKRSIRKARRKKTRTRKDA